MSSVAVSRVSRIYRAEDALFRGHSSKPVEISIFASDECHTCHVDSLWCGVGSGGII